MNAPKDGGPAFPGTENHGLNSGEPGMTLRQYYAAKAMQGELAAMCATDQDASSALPVSITDYELDSLAKHWFRIADAMIRAEAPEVEPKVVTEEMVLAALREMNPDLYGPDSDYPADSPAFSVITERDMNTVRKMLEAALGVQKS